MVFIWGSTNKQREIGWVAELCPRCRAIRAGTLLEVRQLSHVWHVPVGAGSVLGYLFHCTGCHQSYTTSPARYALVALASDVPLHTLIERTNPSLVVPHRGGGYGHGHTGTRRAA